MSPRPTRAEREGSHLALEAVRSATGAGFDLLSITRVPAIACTLRAGIRAEAFARSLRPGVAFSPPDPLHYHEGGAGPAVVLLNGWTASGLVWPARLIRSLERDHRVVRVDNRGSGWSRQAARPYTIRDLAGDARRIIDDLGLGRPTVVGLSMGGMIAQELAMRWPDRVGRLVLLGTRPPGPADTGPSPALAAAMLSTPNEGASLRRFFRDGWLRVAAPGFGAAHPELVEEMTAAIARRPTPRFAVLDQARAIASWNGAHRLDRLKAPTIVVHGAQDPLLPVRNGMRIAQLIPAARYIELPEVGHLVPYEAPAVVERAVRGGF